MTKHSWIQHKPYLGTVSCDWTLQYIYIYIYIFFFPNVLVNFSYFCMLQCGFQYSITPLYVHVHSNSLKTPATFLVMSEYIDSVLFSAFFFFFFFGGCFFLVIAILEILSNFRVLLVLLAINDKSELNGYWVICSFSPLLGFGKTASDRNLVRF